jgi:hypothetical protein
MQCKPKKEGFVKIEVASLLADHFDNKDEGCFIQVFRR